MQISIYKCMQMYLCMCLCLGLCSVHLLDSAGFHLTAAFQKSIYIFFFTGESDHCCIMKEINPKATPLHLLNKKIFGFGVPDRRKLLGVFFPAHPRSVHGCSDSNQPCSSPDWHSEFVSFTSDSKRQGKGGPSTSPSVSVQTHLGHGHQTCSGETVKTNTSESPLPGPLSFCGTIQLSQLCKNLWLCK